MKGLLKNNFYAALSNVKVFSGVMLLLGIFVAAKDKDIQSLMIGYMLLAMIGFPVNAIFGLQKETTTKWGKYKLTAPVSRADIVRSYFLSHVMWLSAGILFAGVVGGMSTFLHGFPLDKNTDVFMILVAGIGISLFMGAIFFPLFCWEGEEKGGAFLVVSLVCAIGVFMGLTSLVNMLFDPGTTAELILAAGVVLAISFLTFGVSYPLTVSVFKRKE